MRSLLLMEMAVISTARLWVSDETHPDISVAGVVKLRSYKLYATLWSTGRLTNRMEVFLTITVAILQLCNMTCRVGFHGDKPPDLHFGGIQFEYWPGTGCSNDFTPSERMLRQYIKSVTSASTHSHPAIFLLTLHNSSSWYSVVKQLKNLTNMELSSVSSRGQDRYELKLRSPDISRSVVYEMRHADSYITVSQLCVDFISFLQKKGHKE